MIIVPTWRILRSDAVPLVYRGNNLTFGGASAMWELLRGSGTVPAFSNSAAHLAVGNGAAALSPSHTALQGASQARAAMDSGYPIHTPSTSQEGARVVFRATFAAGVANFAWRELGLVNAATGGRLFNRRLVDAGEKASPGVWSVELAFELQPAPGSS